MFERFRSSVPSQESAEPISQTPHQHPPFVGISYEDIESSRPVETEGGYLKFRHFDGTNGMHGKTTQERIRRLKYSEELYAELRDHYGVHMPTAHFVIGNEGGAFQFAGYYRYTEKVNGRPLPEALQHEAVPVEELDNLYGRLATYYKDKLLSGEDAVLDIRSEQFMYGHRDGETADHIYLVDEEPFFSREVELGRRNNPDTVLIGQPHTLIDMITEAETARHARLPVARAAVTDLLHTFSPSLRGYDEYVAQQLQVLESQAA